METQIWAAVHTPFMENGAIDENGIRHNVEKYIERGITGIFFNGLMGENWSLSKEECKSIAKLTVTASKGRLKTCAIATTGSIEDTIELGRSYKEIGLDYCCLITPKTLESKEELVSCMNEKMNGIDMPFVIFNAVTPAGSVLTPDVFSILCENPNVKILKTTVNDEVNNALRAVARSDVLVSDPTEEKFFKNATESGQRILFADPEPYLYQTGTFRPIEEYVKLIEVGKLAEARVIFDALAPLREQFNKWILTPFYNGAMTNAYLKKWSELNGFVGGVVRSPLLPLSDAVAREMEIEVHRAQESVYAALGREA
jgi:4-hydroxy-tetrahydrodipicolinate synthase